MIDGYLELACSPAVLYAGRNKEYALHLLYHVGGSVKVSYRLSLQKGLCCSCVCVGITGGGCRPIATCVGKNRTGQTSKTGFVSSIHVCIGQRQFFLLNWFLHSYMSKNSNWSSWFCIVHLYWTKAITGQTGFALSMHVHVCVGSSEAVVLILVGSLLPSPPAGSCEAAAQWAVGVPN